MTTESPNVQIAQIVDPIPYSAVDGTWPNPEAYVKAEIERIVGELRTGFQSDDAAIVAYFNAQLTQVNSIINGLAGGAQLQEALVTLNNLKGIVDADGNGILDALGPLQARLSTLETTVPALQTTQQAQQTSIDALTTQVGQNNERLDEHGDILGDLRTDLITTTGAVRALANNLGRNLQAIRNGLQQVNVNYTPIALPDPVFATTNVTGDAGETPADPANLS